MTLVLEGIALDDPLRRVIEEKMAVLTERRRYRPTVVRVGFTDENGPKGGVDTTCAITIEIPGRPAQHARAVADAPRTAFEAALDALERELRREQGKRRDQARRPRKYYVAHQGLQPDGEAALPSPRRRRRGA
jgi:ribosome-associated translation inhibitor RaiA